MQILNLIVDFLLYTPLPKTLTYFTVLVLAVFLGTFISKRKHLLRTLLSLEGLILILIDKVDIDTVNFVFFVALTLIAYLSPSVLFISLLLFF